MRGLVKLRPSAAMAVAMVALFAALGGVGYAAATIGSAQIKNNSIRGKDIRNSTITGKDVKNNSLTGKDVKESSLGKVPSAAKADSAGTALSANAAGSVNTVKTIPLVTVEEGGTPATLATYGPFTITGSCVAAGGSTVANVNLATTEDNSNVQGLDSSDSDFDASESPFEFDTFTDAAGGTPNGGSYDSTVNAFAPSGRAFAGPIAAWADASAGASGQCKFHGNIVISG